MERFGTELRDGDGDLPSREVDSAALLPWLSLPRRQRSMSLLHWQGRGASLEESFESSPAVTRPRRIAMSC
jgi:hypothetical protein